MPVNFFDKVRLIILNTPNWLFIFCLTFVINTIFGFVLLNIFKVEMFPEYYHIIAQNLLDGNGYAIESGIVSAIIRAPGYTFFLAAMYCVFGLQHIPVVLTHILLNSLTTVFLYLLIKKIFSPLVGLLSAIMYAFYPFAVYYLVRALPTIFVTFLLMLLIIAMYRLYDAPNWLNAFIFGCATGIIVLTKPVFQGFLFFLFLWIAGKAAFNYCYSEYSLKYKTYAQKLSGTRSFFKPLSKEIIKPLTLGFIILFGQSIIIMPWIIRNYKVSGEFPVISTGGGYTLWLGNNIHYNGKDYKQLPIEQAIELMKEELNIINDGITIQKIRGKKYSSIKNKITTSVSHIYSKNGDNHFASIDINYSIVDKDYNHVPKNENAVGLPNVLKDLGTYEYNLKNDKKFYFQAIRNFVDYPKETAFLMIKKSFRLWFSIFSLEMKKYQLLVTVIQLLIILPAILGIFFSLKNRIRFEPLIIVIIYFQLIYTIFIATVRYVIPVMPLIMGFAAYGIVEVYRKISLYYKNRELKI